MPTFRFHYLGIGHLPCTREYCHCAYTSKVYKLSKMLLSLGHEVFFYGCEGSTVPCTRYIVTHTLKDIRRDYGDGDNRFEIGYDYRLGDFRNDWGISPKKPSTDKFLAQAIQAINACKKSDDFLLLSMGLYHKPVADAVQLYLTCEPGIGYRGSYLNAYKSPHTYGSGAKSSGFRAFESHYMRSYMEGVETQNNCTDGKNYDRVIPNYFEDEDFRFEDKKQDYILYIGRMISRKGINVAYRAAKEAGVLLKLAGQGGYIRADGSFGSNVDPSINLPRGGWEYVGYADVEMRKELYANAKAVMVPTSYMEPFGGTHVESFISGTPAICSDYGVFPGTIPDLINGRIGFRCNTLDDYVKAIRKCQTFGPDDYQAIRKYGERFLMDNVRWDFEKWFQDLMRVYLSATVPGEKGWGWVEK